MTLKFCMGAYCAHRDNCPNYSLGYGAGEVPDSVAVTVERLCKYGREEYHLVEVDPASSLNAGNSAGRV